MNILIPILAGSELRQFFHSHIAKDLIESGLLVYVIPKYDNIQLINEIKGIDDRIKILPHIMQPVSGSMFSYLRFLLDEHYDHENKRWRYSEKTNYNFWKRIIIAVFLNLLRINFIRRFLLSIEQYLLERIDVSQLEDLLITNNISKLVLSNARFLSYPELLIACKKLDIPVDVIYHSNKEIVAQPRINYSYHKFGVWNKQMYDEMTYLYPQYKGKCHIIGNSHFTYLNGDVGILSYDYFKEYYNIKDNSLVILYTASGTIVRNEVFIVDYIAAILDKTSRNYKIIVRKNPMDTTDNWNSYFSNNNKICIQNPKWVMDDIIGLNYTKSNDLSEFKTLLKYISFCINIPSTITLECAIMKKPVINICFQFPDVNVVTNAGKIVEFWEAPFYKPYHGLDFVLPTFNLDQLKEQIYVCIQDSQNFKDYDFCVKKQLGQEIGNVNKKILEFIS
jgi:hypothetical protein